MFLYNLFFSENKIYNSIEVEFNLISLNKVLNQKNTIFKL
jgi:hypothetical protein